MSSILRGPWLIDLTRKKLADGIAQRDGGAVEPGKVLDTIGPLGELQFPGDKFKLLQVIEVSCLNPPEFVFSSPTHGCSIHLLHDDYQTHNFRSAVSKSISCGKLKYLIFPFRSLLVYLNSRFNSVSNILARLMDSFFHTIILSPLSCPISPSQ